MRPATYHRPPCSSSTSVPRFCTEDRYEFECQVRYHRPLRRRILRPRSATITKPDVPPRVVRFGFRTSGWRLEHHPVWDAIYPLLSLTRNGGPLFGTRHRRATIRMACATPVAVRDFFVRRAHDLGPGGFTIQGETSHATFDGPPPRHRVRGREGEPGHPGMLRETGDDLAIVSSWAQRVDLPHALVSDPMGPALIDRVMPALMSRGRDLYLGGTLGGSHRTHPWHRYFDVSAPAPLRETARMLAAVGLPTVLHSPLAIVPPNVGQRVLHDRYPDLYRHQYSTRDGGSSEKNLHVACANLHHGIGYQRHCPPELFARLLERFVAREATRPDDFGPRSEREVISREMCGPSSIAIGASRSSTGCGSDPGRLGG
ncbi:MAG: hypothetical protein R3C32_03640 [Chloroflexota bacterium]